MLTSLKLSERMLHTRIKKWKIGRNHKFLEMRTAAQILAVYQESQSSRLQRSGCTSATSASKRAEQPSFSIRGESVSYDELMRYFRRKKIPDPVSWARGQEGDGFVLSEDVLLVSPTIDPNMGEASSIDEGNQGVLERDPAPEEWTEPCTMWTHTDVLNPSDMLQWGSDLDCNDVDNLVEPESELAYSDDAHPASNLALQYTSTSKSTSPIPMFVRPETFSALERVVHNMTTYMSSYLTSVQWKQDHEPVIHAHTKHAIFASKMQDGISILSQIPSADTTKTSLSHGSRQQPTATDALVSFNNGLGLIPKILEDHNPMPLSLMLSIVCEYASHTKTAKLQSLGVSTLLTRLLQYTYDESKTILGRQHPMTMLFYTLAQEFFLPNILTSDGSPPLADMIFKVFEIAITQLQFYTASYSTTSPEHPPDWKQLYLRERFCDALYHSGSTFQDMRCEMRKRVLYDQQKKDGLTARNVLWTLTNVADDCLAVGDVESAIEWFQTALERAGSLVEDYGRAKTSFAALEGLGRCWVRKADGAAQIELVFQQPGQEHAQLLSNSLQNISTHYSRAGTVSPCYSCQCHSHSASTNPSPLYGARDQTEICTPATSSRSRTHSPPQNLRMRYLHKALDYFTQAESEAKAYFEASSRRITRVGIRRLEVVEMLGLATPSSSNSSPKSGAGPVYDSGVSGVSNADLHMGGDLGIGWNGGSQIPLSTGKNAGYSIGSVPDSLVGIGPPMSMPIRTETSTANRSDGILDLDDQTVAPFFRDHGID